MSLVTCKECNKEISSEAKVCPNCGKQLKTSGTQIAIGCIIVLICLSLLGGVIYTVNSEFNNSIFSTFVGNNNSKKITKENYNKIKEEMTEKEVKNILGEPTSSTETVMESVGKIKLKHYQENTKAIEVYFKDGKVYMKNWTEL